MNKKIIETLSKFDFTYEKNYGYGHIDGYEVNVFNDPFKVGPIFFFSTFLTQAKKNDFVSRFNGLKIKLCNALYFDFGVGVMIGCATAGGFQKKFDEVMPKILDLLHEFEAPKNNICPGTNEEFIEGDSNMEILNGTSIKIKLSSKAIAAQKSYIKQDEENYAAAPNNYLKGLVGIILGGLIGAATAFAFGLLGFITWLAPFVSIFLGIFFYKRFGGKPTLMMVFMSFIVTLILILAASFASDVITCIKFCDEEGFAQNGFDAFIFIVENFPEVRESLIRDIVVNALIIVIVEIISIFDVKKQVRRIRK